MSNLEMGRLEKIQEDFNEWEKTLKDKLEDGTISDDEKNQIRGVLDVMAYKRKPLDDFYELYFETFV